MTRPDIEAIDLGYIRAVGERNEPLSGKEILALCDRITALESALTRETEECAKVADGWLTTFGAVEPEFVDAKTWATDAIKDIADCIRARAAREG